MPQKIKTSGPSASAVWEDGRLKPLLCSFLRLGIFVSVIADSQSCLGSSETNVHSLRDGGKIDCSFGMPPIFAILIAFPERRITGEQNTSPIWGKLQTHREDVSFLDFESVNSFERMTTWHLFKSPEQCSSGYKYCIISNSNTVNEV